MAKKRRKQSAEHRTPTTAESSGGDERPPDPAATPSTVRTLPSAVRAAAERETFGATGEGIVWAVVGTGIHARHLQFDKYQNLSLAPPLRHRDFTAPFSDDGTSEMEALVDAFGHGTHGAGIIAGELRGSLDAPLVVELREIDEEGVRATGHATIPEVSGVAPKCKLISLKVLDDRGMGNLSGVIAALQSIREVNAEAGALLIHGVTLGVGYEYETERFACGQSPICVAVNESVRAGVVVVAAAGNTGFGHHKTDAGAKRGAVPMSINDPGNAEYAITVGSTHGSDPHLYGVSYFSSKGPTADGRQKPDIVAPGERIISCAPSQPADADHSTRGVRYREDTGTDAAASYVSGVIAALLSVRRELIGQPLAVKQLLMSTAEDLKRDRYLQGHGLVSLIRALAESGTSTRNAPRPAVKDQIAPLGPAVPAPAPTSAVVDPGAAKPASRASGKRFAVALSFPGERRDYVKKVVWALRDIGLPREAIFYDRFYEAELVGPNLDSRLQKIYHDDSELIVIFVSAEYDQKEWCGLEWRAIRDILKRRRDEDVMPLRFDDTEVPGLFSIDGYIDLRKRDPEQVADLVYERLSLNRRRRQEA